MPFYEYDEARFFCSDDAPPEIAARRRAGFMRLSALYRRALPKTIRRTAEVAGGISDLQFTDAYRVPFQYSRLVRQHLTLGRVRAIVGGRDGHRSRRQSVLRPHRLLRRQSLRLRLLQGGIARGLERVRELGPVLGAYHPVIADNVRRLQEISGLDEVSFHMSGTEAVMQAVRLARYHTRRSHLVRFCGAYHGWWGDVQPGIGNPVPARETYTLKDMSEDTLRVLRTRRDIACVLVNPLQALHPNAGAPADASLVDSARSAHFDKGAYADWLKQLRAVCTERNIVLIFDEVFVGFRLARRRRAGVFRRPGRPRHLRQDARRRASDRRPLRPQGPDEAVPRRPAGRHLLCARHVQLASLRDGGDERVPAASRRRRRRARSIATSIRSGTSGRSGSTSGCASEALPVQVANLSSIWTVCYTQPSRYNWMLQYYLRAEGLALSWIGTGRLIFSLNYTDADFDGGGGPLRGRGKSDAATTAGGGATPRPPTSRSSAAS